MYPGPVCIWRNIARLIRTKSRRSFSSSCNTYKTMQIIFKLSWRSWVITCSPDFKRHEDLVRMDSKNAICCGLKSRSWKGRREGNNRWNSFEAAKNGYLIRLWWFKVINVDDINDLNHTVTCVRNIHITYKWSFTLVLAGISLFSSSCKSKHSQPAWWLWPQKRRFGLPDRVFASGSMSTKKWKTYWICCTPLKCIRFER